MTHVLPDRPNSGMTMTVSELIEELRKYNPDLPVIATWESVAAGIRSENFSVDEYSGRKELVIDVEDYG